MEPPEDEVLPGSDRPPPSRRARLTVGALVAAAVLAAGVVVLRQHSDGQPDAGPTSAGRSPSPTLRRITDPPPTRTFTLDPTSGVVLVDPPCLDIGNSSLNCVSVTIVPVAVDKAVRAALPDFEVASSRSVLSRSGRLAVRTLVVRDGAGRTVRIEVGPPTGRRSLIAVLSIVSPRLIRFDADVNDHQHHVTITARTPVGVAVPSFTALRRLAADRRLATP